MDSSPITISREPQSDDVELIECFVRSDKPFTNASIISVFRKLVDRYEEEGGK